MARSQGLALVAAFALLLMPAVATAQINPTLTEAERGIRDADLESAKHLRIDELLVTATVIGRTADVTLELLIGSDSEDDYEAKLALALPADAVVTGYSLSVGKMLIAGQLLEQPKARNVYEDEVRAGIDPGLAEVSAGNRFTTRIYPINSKNPRRVRISFVAPFDPETGIVLPFARDATIGKVELNVAVYGYATAPTVSFAGKRLTLSREGPNWRGASVQKGVLRDGLVVNGGDASWPDGDRAARWRRAVLRHQ